MSDFVHLYDTQANQWWRASGQGYTPDPEEAYPWERVVAEPIVEMCEWLEIREIEPEDILI